MLILLWGLWSNACKAVGASCPLEMVLLEKSRGHWHGGRGRIGLGIITTPSCQTGHGGETALTARASALYCSPTGRRLIVRINFRTRRCPDDVFICGIEQRHEATLHCCQGLRALCRLEHAGEEVVPETARTHQTPPMDAMYSVPHEDPEIRWTSSQLHEAETVKSTTLKQCQHQPRGNCACASRGSSNIRTSFSSALR